jgi:hypothetical protein
MSDAELLAAFQAGDTDGMYDRFMPWMVDAALDAADGNEQIADYLIEAVFAELRAAGPLDQSLVNWLSPRFAWRCVATGRYLRMKKPLPFAAGA